MGEGAVDGLREAWPGGEFPADRDDVHGWEDPGAVVVALHALVVGEEPGDLRRAVEQGLRDVDRGERVDLAGFEHGPERLVRASGVVPVPVTLNADHGARVVMGLLHGLVLQRIAFGLNDPALMTGDIRILMGGVE